MSKYTEDDLKKELETKEYEYGFYTDLESETFPIEPVAVENHSLYNLKTKNS